MKTIGPLLSSNRQDWRTPEALLDRVELMGPIALDPCASSDPSHHFAAFNLTKEDDGLSASWEVAVGDAESEEPLIFVNSEYGRALPRWVAKCRSEYGNGCEIIQLTPNRPGVRWYRMAQAASTAMCSLHGRLTFEGAENCAPFPSALFCYGPRPYLFCHTFDAVGDVRLLGAP